MWPSSKCVFSALSVCVCVCVSVCVSVCLFVSHRRVCGRAVSVCSVLSLVVQSMFHSVWVHLDRL